MRLGGVERPEGKCAREVLIFAQHASATWAKVPSNLFLDPRLTAAAPGELRLSSPHALLLLSNGDLSVFPGQQQGPSGTVDSGPRWASESRARARMSPRLPSAFGLISHGPGRRGGVDWVSLGRRAVEV